MPIEPPACQIGASAPDFQLPDVNGNSVSLSDFAGTSGLVVAFICNHCPYVKAVINDFVTDANLLMDEGIGVVAIMSNDYDSYPDDSPQKMIDFAIEHKFGFPYLVDESQDIARRYEAVCTPDLFGFNSDFRLQYRGRLDNLRMERNTDRTPDLVNAMLEIKRSGVFTGDQKPSAGCSIKWR